MRIKGLTLSYARVDTKSFSSLSPSSSFFFFEKGPWLLYSFHGSAAKASLSLCHIFYIKVWTIHCESTIYRLYGIYFLAGMLQQLVKHSKSLHKFLSVLRFNLFRA